MDGIYSSKKLTEEIKIRIRKKYKNQENFAKEFGSSRKTLNRLINHSKDLDSILRICEMLEIKGILIA
mgnify:CR=1 FL=1